ncbi:hypothetical protein B0H11DRAFT_114903 [Mycena galericulata]|nr:hypothetical protein B0H11DRAFT_114903 [Mycena galericulata]
MSSASWIWTADSNGAASTAAGNVAFLKNFTTPPGQTASSALISMTAVDNFVVWVNGQPIGASDPVQDEWKTAQVLRAELNASVNVFSVLVVNGANSAAPPPGLLAAIQISFADNTTYTVLSDASWLATRNIPADFPSPANPLEFSPAAVAAAYGSGPWGQNVNVPPPSPNSLNLTASTWIWSTPGADLSAPVGFVGFRKTITTPAGKSAQSATVLFTVDNTFALYLNGDYVGSPPEDGVWEYAQQFTVDMNPTVNVFTVVAENNALDGPGSAVPTAAGFIGAIEVFYADGTSDIIRTDSSWLNSPGNYLTLPIFLSTNDSLLNQSIPLGPLGIAPWGQIAISDALDAASVPSAPFGSSNTSSSASPSPAIGRSSHTVPVTAIVGVVVGLLVLSAIIIGVIFWWRRRRNSFSNLKEHPAVAPSDTVIPFAEYAFTVPPAVPTPVMTTFASSDRLPPPTMSRPRGKFDAAAVTRTSDTTQVEYAEAPPPSYSDSNVGSALAVDGGSSR